MGKKKRMRQKRKRLPQTAPTGDTSGLSEDWGADAGSIKAYCCPSCGAELLCDATTAATSCPYCGNPSVIPGQFSGILKPDFVLPFKLSKEDAVRALKGHYKGKFFLPKSFTQENHVQEIQGIYVPSGCLTARRRRRPLCSYPLPYIPLRRLRDHGDETLRCLPGRNRHL